MDKTIDNIESKLPIQLTVEEMKYAQTPLGGAILEASERKRVSRLEKLLVPNTNPKRAYVQCEICGKVYTKNNGSTHRKSQFHRSHEDLNKKLVAILRPNFDATIPLPSRQKARERVLTDEEKREYVKVMQPRVYDRIDDRAERNLESETDESSSELSESDY